MSPANIEQAINGGQSLIGQIVAIGDRRPYNVALVVLDRDGAAALAHEHGLEHLSYAELTRRPEIRAAVQAAVDEGNEKLSRVEQIKRFTILDHDWVPGGEELTPTLKLKRREIAARYETDIEALYEARTAADLRPEDDLRHRLPGEAERDSLFFTLVMPEETDPR
jgi:long-subunit acyl-CoA synthetase (AMP-forming)